MFRNKKILRKSLCFVITVNILFFSMCFAYADEAEDDYNLRSTPVILNVTSIQQENGYYCRAATTQMVLKYFGKSTKIYTQSYLYNLISSTSGNTTSDQIASVLTSIIPNKNYSCTTYTSLTQNTFKNKIKSSIDNDRPVIMSGKVFPYHSYSPGHFVVVKGYRIEDTPLSSLGDSIDSLGSIANIRFLIIDPTNDSDYYGTHWLSASDLYYAMISNEGAIICGH